MADSLVWLCVKNNNAFLVKRGKKNSRCGATMFSKESGNLLNVNSFKYSGLANSKAIDIDHSMNLNLKAPKKSNAPAKNVATIPLKKCAKTSAKVVKSQGCNNFYRADLTAAATGRYAKLYRSSHEATNFIMVYGLVRSVQAAVKYRGGWKGLLEHMYTNGDYPFKMGTFMGSDAAGNRYYENRIDYPFGQHRWVEPGDIHNYDSSSVAPEWHGWMTSMNDDPPCSEDTFIAEKTETVEQMCRSDAPDKSNLGLMDTDNIYNFHDLHNQSQIRSRGYGIGNPIVGLPPGVKDGFYTQPGSPYNEASIRPLEFVGSLDKDGGRSFKNSKWAERLRTAEEKKAMVEEQVGEVKSMADMFGSVNAKRGGGRGGTSVGN